MCRGLSKDTRLMCWTIIFAIPSPHFTRVKFNFARIAVFCTRVWICANRFCQHSTVQRRPRVGVVFVFSLSFEHLWISRLAQRGQTLKEVDELMCGWTECVCVCVIAFLVFITTSWVILRIGPHTDILHIYELPYRDRAGMPGCLSELVTLYWHRHRFI